MKKEIVWENDLNLALTRAQKENKPVFLDFHNPN